MTINDTTALEHPVEALEKSSGCTGRQATIPSQDEDRKILRISWIFKYIVKFSREKELFILKTEHCIFRKWNSRAQIKDGFGFWNFSFQDKRRNVQFLKPEKQNTAKQTTHIQGLLQVFSHFIAVILVFHIEEKTFQERNSRKKTQTLSFSLRSSYQNLESNKNLN